MALTKDEILAKKLGRRTVTLPSGGEVIVRGLNRNEAMSLRDEPTNADRDNLMISLGLVEPKLTQAEVAAWTEEAGAGDAVEISMAIAELSGMAAGAPKEATKSVPRRGR
jgi:hypothetical protein